MKQHLTPQPQILFFNASDIITTSGGSKIAVSNVIPDIIDGVADAGEFQ